MTHAALRRAIFQKKLKMLFMKTKRLSLRPVASAHLELGASSLGFGISLACFLLSAFCFLPGARANTNLSAALQQALFEEEANHNLNGAIQSYQSLITQFEQDRKLAATAIFRLGEC